MTELLHTCRLWFTRTVAWSNSRQAWEERAGAALLAASALTVLWLGPRLTPARQAVLWGLLLLAGALVLRRGGVKLFGPVFFYDVVRAARRGRYFAMRILYAGALVAVLLWLYFIWTLRFPDSAIPNREIADLAESFFLAFVAVQFGVAVLVTPAYAAGAIAEEKEHRTLEYLLATDLRNREIVLGKLAARLANLTLLLLTGLPILSLLQLLGGIDPELLLSFFALTGLTMASLASLSILCSVYNRRAREAILLTYIAGFLYVGLSAGSLTLLTYPETADAVLIPGQQPYTLKDFLFTLNAGNPFVFAGRLAYEVGIGTALNAALPPLARDYAIFHGLVIVVSCTWAVLRLRAVAMQQAQGRVFRQARNLPRWGRPRIRNSPMLWKEVFEPGFRFSWLGRGITYMVFIMLFVPALTVLVDILFFSGVQYWHDTMAAWVRGVVAGAASLTLLSVAVRAAGSLSGERDRQTLDGLLATPLPSRSILFSKWLGSILSMRWAWLMLAFTWLLGAFGEGLSFWAIPAMIAAWLVYAALLAQVGLWFSLVSPTSLRATLRTLLVAIALTVGHWLLWGYYLPYLLMTQTQRESAEWLVHLHFGLTPPAVLAWLAFSLDKLADWDYATFWSLGRSAAVGLICWAVAAVVLGRLTRARFRKMYQRESVRVAERAPVSGQEEAELLRRITRPEVWSRRRRRLGIAVLAALPVLALVGVYAYVSWDANRKLRAVIAEIEAEDPNWRLADIEATRKSYAPEENAAGVAIAARRLLPRPWPPAPPTTPGSPSRQWSLDEQLGGILPEQQLDVWQLGELRKELEKKMVAAARAKARDLEHVPGGRIAINWAPDVYSTLLPDLQEMRTIARLLQLDAMLRAHDGDADGALTSTRALLNTAGAIGDEPLMISQLVRIAVQTIACQTAERTLAQGEPSPQALKRTQEFFEERERFPLLWMAFRGERAAVHEIMQEVARGKAKISRLGVGGGAGVDFLAMASSKGAHIWMLQYMTRAVALTKLPMHQQLPALDRLEKELKNSGPWIARLLLPAYLKIAGAGGRNQAMLRCAAAALAVERYRREHGRWPAQLQDLVPKYVAAVPPDPYDGRPLRYLRLADGVMIYSMGADGKDDGGKMDWKRLNQAGTDLGVRLWDVAHRRQPPRNPEMGPPAPPPDQP